MMISTENDGSFPAFRDLAFANHHRCPKCASLVYSRKSLFCGICGIHLPEGFRWKEEKRRQLSEMLELERVRHRHWLARREERGLHN